MKGQHMAYSVRSHSAMPYSVLSYSDNPKGFFVAPFGKLSVVEHQDRPGSVRVSGQDCQAATMEVMQ